jgi:hypothetical protein
MAKKRWIPGLASVDLEEQMKAQDIPEVDRDEVRRFAEFLKRRKDRTEGKPLEPAPEGMREWLLGKE